MLPTATPNKTLLATFIALRYLLYEALTWGLDPLANGTKFITVCHESAVYQSDRCQTLYEIAGGQWLLLDRGTAVRNVMCGKCGAVERALCGGCNGGLSCLWRATEMEWLYISLGPNF
jgi:hypothetical protein